jgi:hypothetical protein
LNYDQIKNNLILHLLRIRCKRCFKPFSKESFWHTGSSIFSEKKFFNIKDRPDFIPLKRNIKFITTKDPLIARETRSLTKQFSYDKYNILNISLFCSYCDEVLNIEYIIDGEVSEL